MRHAAPPPPPPEEQPPEPQPLIGEVSYDREMDSRWRPTRVSLEELSQLPRRAVLAWGKPHQGVVRRDHVRQHGSDEKDRGRDVDLARDRHDPKDDGADRERLECLRVERGSRLRLIVDDFAREVVEDSGCLAVRLGRHD